MTNKEFMECAEKIQRVLSIVKNGSHKGIHSSVIANILYNLEAVELDLENLLEHIEPTGSEEEQNFLKRNGNRFP